MTEYMLTTVDNPFDPFTQFDEWRTYDLILGYDTLGLLARITKTSDDLSYADEQQAIDDAMDEIVEINASGMHRKVASTV